MKPAWDKLMKEYKDHPTIVIADVDCTAEGQSLCETQGVEGYPTIKYGDPDNLEDYNGARDLKGLQKFAKESLGPTCGPANLDLCDAEKTKEIEELIAMGVDALTEAVSQKQAAVDAEAAKFDQKLTAIKERYEELSKEKDEKLAKLQGGPGLPLMRSVLKIKAAALDALRDELPAESLDTPPAQEL